MNRALRALYSAPKPLSFIYNLSAQRPFDMRLIFLVCVCVRVFVLNPLHLFCIQVLVSDSFRAHFFYNAKPRAHSSRRGSVFEPGR